MATDGSGAANATTGVFADQYSFAFQKIVVTWANGNETATDNWLTPGG